MKGKTVNVLLVEDDDVDAMDVKRSFEKMKIANPITRARDGLEALEILRSKSVAEPLVIMLDLQMPRMNGHEFLSALRADEELNHHVVFVLTTSEDEDDVIASYRRHVAGYCIKSESGRGFLDVVTMLDGYWNVVKLPDRNDEGLI